jgi:hypothetical protein
MLALGRGEDQGPYRRHIAPPRDWKMDDKAAMVMILITYRTALLIGEVCVPAWDQVHFGEGQSDDERNTRNKGERELACQREIARTN